MYNQNRINKGVNDVMKTIMVVLLMCLTLAGCRGKLASDTLPQYVKKTPPDAIQLQTMEERCKDEAAGRYNTSSKTINLLNIENFRGSYEMYGSTAHQDIFTCSFDTHGEFLHLSIR